tara:strand:+ start:211 stop:831 length:621 start_codon:yes stop_codon:yes gene_type:complete
MNDNPFDIVRDFEEKLAEFTGAPYVVTTNSCTMALFLCVSYMKYLAGGTLSRIQLPAKTFVSVPCSVNNAGGRVVFKDFEWTSQGEYKLVPYPVWDSALLLKPNMFNGEFQCISFHYKKPLAIGRGGAILCPDRKSYEWLMKMHYNGRDIFAGEDRDKPNCVGWHAHMFPEEALRGLILLHNYKQRTDFPISQPEYLDLREYDIYG